jgi:copper chaperone
MRFRTNIGCSFCIKAGSFFLDDDAQILDWHIDVNHPEKILTIKGLMINKQKIIRKLTFAGFNIENIDGACDAGK